MEQKLASLLRVLSAAETQVDTARASLAKSAKEAFKLIDTSGRDILSSFEVSNFLEKNNVKIEQDEVRMIVQYYDILRKGKLDLEAFQRALTPRNKKSSENAQRNSDLKENLIDFFNKELDLIRKTHNLRVQLVQTAQTAKTDVYKILKKDGKGELTLEDIDSFLQKQGFKLSNAEVQAILQRGDRNGENIMTQHDFEAFIVPDVLNKKVLAKEPELTQSNSYSGLAQSQKNKPLGLTVSDTPLTVSQIVNKYDTSKNNNYNVPLNEQRPAITNYRIPQAAYLTRSDLMQDLDTSNMPYSTTYKPELYKIDNKYTPYYPGMYSNSPTQSKPTLQIDPNPDYHIRSSHGTPQNYSTVSHDLRASQYGYHREPVRTMNKSMSTSTFNFASPKIGVYDRGYPQDFFPINSRYDHHSRELMSASFYQRPIHQHDRPRYENLHYRPRSPHAYEDIRRMGSLSPKYGYEGPLSPREYALYEPQFSSPKYERGLYTTGARYRKEYNGPRTHHYESFDHLKVTADMLDRRYVVPQHPQNLGDWGVSTVFTPKISRNGAALYDVDQLRHKYNNLTRTNF